MKKNLLALLLICSLSYGQNPETTLEKIAKAILDKGQKEEKYMKNVVTQTIIVNSSSKANFGSGNTRSAIKINLPVGTKVWYYRITLMDVNANFAYPDSDTFYSVFKDKKPFTVNNLTQNRVDFYIIDNNSVQNFLTNGNNNFGFYEKYSKTKTMGFIDSCELLSNNLWIGIKNPNFKDGIKAIVEIVSLGNY